MATGDMYTDAHRHSINHRSEVIESERCGCFYCLSLFPPGKIKEWTDRTDDDDVGQTALCPYCGIDSVLGSKSGFPITKDFMKIMNRHWFRGA